MKLDQEPKILALAETLGLETKQPVQTILRHCETRIEGWIADHPNKSTLTIAELEKLVTQHLQMVFEEIYSDDHFTHLTQKYVKQKKEFVFAYMRDHFSDTKNPIYGTLIKCKHAPEDSPDRFVAVIDCRGDKFHRRFFTKWHEIAHRFTTHADNGDEEPAYPSENDPIERLMDEIASCLGFYQPIFDRAFKPIHGFKSKLTFDTVNQVKQNCFPDASFEATLNACMQRFTMPVLYLEAKIAHKKSTKQRIDRHKNTPFLFEDMEYDPGKLRAVKVVPNSAARLREFQIPYNMRIPKDSIISTIFSKKHPASGSNTENLESWESNNKPLGKQAIEVEALKQKDRVIALIHPVDI